MQRRRLRIRRHGTILRKYSQRPQFEGFVAATKALHSMPDGEEDVTLALKDSKIELFGIVANDDKVFLNLMQDMKKDIPNLEIKVIDECDHWMIVENPEAVDEALGEFLDTIKVLA